MVLLRHGDTEGRFPGDGSRVIGSIVFDALNRGCQRDYILRLLKDPQHKGGFACLNGRRGDLDRWFERYWARAAARWADRAWDVGDRHEATMRAVELAEHVDCMKWKGIAGNVDRAVYLFVLTVAARAGRLGPLGLSVREVAEGVGIDRRTAGRSLARLVERGLLWPIAAGRGRYAATYQVDGGRKCPTVPSQAADVGAPQSPPEGHAGGGRNCPTPSHPPVGMGPDWGTYVPSDAWRWRGLGLAKARTWGLLSDDGISTSALAGLLGVDPRTARRHVAALAEHGLAARLDGAWVRGPADPDAVAEEIGTAGTLERQRQRHQLERRLREEARIAHAATHGGAPFAVDPETGEVIPFDHLLLERPRLDEDAAVALLLAAFPGSEVVTVHEEVAA